MKPDTPQFRLYLTTGLWNSGAFRAS